MTDKEARGKKAREILVAHLRKIADGIESESMELEAWAISDDCIFNTPMLGMPTPTDRRKLEITVSVKY